MPFYDFRCKCGYEDHSQFRRIADRDLPLDCPLDGHPMERFMAMTHRAVTTDEIPGGVWIENLGKHPVKVYSHSDRLRIAANNGLEEFVRHQPLQGSDKSPHTTDWSRGSIDQYTLDAAAALVRDRSRGSNYDEQTPEVRADYFEHVRDVREFTSAIRRTVNE